MTAPYNIRWADRYSNDGSDTDIKITVHAKHPYDFNTGYPYKVQFLYLQGGGTQYQVQFRTRKRMVFGEGDALDGMYTDWTRWSDSSFDTSASQKTNDANKWDFANFAGDNITRKNQPYCTLRTHSFSQATNDGTQYDRLQYEFRVRQYRHSSNPDERRHGDWAYQTLDVWFCPDMIVGEANDVGDGFHCFMDAKGNIKLPYQVPWTRNDGEVVFNSIVLWRDGVSKELVTEPFKVGTIYGTQTRPGRSMLQISAKKLHGDIDIGDHIVIKDAIFRASSGEEGKVYALNGPDADQSIAVKAWANVTQGVPELSFVQTPRMALIVRAHKQTGDPMWWRGAECAIKWTAPDGTVHTLHQDSSKVEGGYEAECTFLTPPLTRGLPSSSRLCQRQTTAEALTGASQRTTRPLSQRAGSSTDATLIPP